MQLSSINILPCRHLMVVPESFHLPQMANYSCYFLRTVVCTVKIVSLIGRCFDLCFKCTSGFLYIRKKLICAFCFLRKVGRFQCSLYLYWFAQIWAGSWKISNSCHSGLYIILIQRAVVPVAQSYWPTFSILIPELEWE